MTASFFFLILLFVCFCFCLLVKVYGFGLRVLGFCVRVGVSICFITKWICYTNKMKTKIYHLLLYSILRKASLEENYWSTLSHITRLIFLWNFIKIFNYLNNIWHRAFPVGPVVKTLHSQCRGPGFNPWSGN